LRQDPDVILVGEVESIRRLLHAGKISRAVAEANVREISLLNRLALVAEGQTRLSDVVYTGELSGDFVKKMHSKDPLVARPVPSSYPGGTHFVKRSSSGMPELARREKSSG
jgi:hypothetical protein